MRNTSRFSLTVGSEINIPFEVMIYPCSIHKIVRRIQKREMRFEVEAIVQHSTFYQLVFEHKHTRFVFSVLDILQYSLYLIETVVIPELGTNLIEPEFRESDFPFQHIRTKTVVVSLHQQVLSFRNSK